MGFALGWIAVALAGVGAAPPAERWQEQIRYTVRVVEAEGVGWREAVFTRLKPVTRQGAATVWTLSHDATKRLVDEICKNPAAHVLQAPKVTAFGGATATFFCRRNEQLITQVGWNGDEAAPEGASEAVRVGWHTTMVGRKLDQGILVKLVFEDTEIRAIHRVKLNRSSEPECSSSTKSGGSEPQVFKDALAEAEDAIRITRFHSRLVNLACAEETCTETQACCQSVESGDQDHGVRKVAIEIPEIGSQEVLGEWLIPRGESLLVSFGVHTVAGKNGKAVVKERLAIVGAEEVSSEAASAAPAVLQRLPEIPFRPVPIPNIPMPAPSAPSRTIPQGYHADGTPADLPPLPADETDADSSESDSSEPMPSPQTKKPQQPKPAADSGANKAAFAPPRSPAVFLPSVFLARPSVGFQFLLPLSPLSLKLPFNQRLEIEIYGRMVPDGESR
ncbi:MAG: hypothetical protein ACHRXM_16390 [Isosphaerales bacterium]